MNWGYRIVLGFALFACFVFYLVYRMVTSGNDLVTAQAYKSGAQVDSEIKLRNASEALHQQFRVRSAGDGSIELRFLLSGPRPEGRFTFTCLSSEKGDLSGNLDLIRVDSAWVQVIRPVAPHAGNWLCELKGSQNGQDFLLRDEFQTHLDKQP